MSPICVIPINKFARELLVKELLENTMSLPTHALHALIFTSTGADQSTRGASLEELVLYDLLFKAVSIETTDEYGRPFSHRSGLIHMCAQDFVLLQDEERMLRFVPFIPTLLRGYARFPVWDFVYVAKANDMHMSTVIFIQCSVSAFRDHDRDSAKIENAFATSGEKWGTDDRGRARNCVEALLDACLGVSDHVAKCEGAELCAFASDGKGMPNVHFLYLTTSEQKKSGQPRYTNLRFAFRKRLPRNLKDIVDKAIAAKGPGSPAASMAASMGKQRQIRAERDEEEEKEEEVADRAVDEERVEEKKAVKKRAVAEKKKVDREEAAVADVDPPKKSPRLRSRQDRRRGEKRL